MSTRLFPYEHVPMGFEIVIDLGSQAEQGVEGEIVPGSKGGTWNLWFNITLSDDPESWDDEVKAINKMQECSGELTDDQRLIRAQMAEFCRLHPLFPRSIDILCEEIGTSRFSAPTRMGCEGRGLLNALGYNDSQSMNAQRKEILEDYATTLKAWLARNHPQNATDCRVFGSLGKPTDDKAAFVEKLVAILDPEDSSIVAIRRVCAEECQKTRGESIFDTPARPFNCFNCDQSSLEPPNCLCCYSMLLDAGLICTGTSGEERSIYQKHIFVQESILAYAMAINSWLEGALPKDAKWPDNTKYVTRDNALLIGERVHSSLANKKETKEWLAACLLKTVTGNQRWFKSTELIDRFPQATSWFREMPRS